MSARAYDVILTVNDASSFEATNVIIGNTSLTTGIIANVTTGGGTEQIKVKLNNVLQEFSSSEVIHSNVATISGTANGALNTSSLPFQSNTLSGNVTTAIATVSGIANSPYKAEKNAFTQNPVVRLYTIYYPGEWYPPNAAGNPTEQGDGRAWPNEFPLRFAEIRGDLTSDILYNVTYGGTSYIPFPINSTSFSQGNDGKVDEITIDIFNVDNVITRLVEDPFLAGNNSSNAVTGYVNGELVNGLDPRTVTGHAQYDQTVVDSIYGKANASWTRSETITFGDTWVEQKADSRDLLGAVVEIKTTFANFLDVWPEYSTVQSRRSNVIEVYNALPYRVGDTIKSNVTTQHFSIQAIEENRFLYCNVEIGANATSGDKVFIVNSEADSESYIEDKFKIDQLEGLNDSVAKFGLISWLQYFKIVTPKRKYYKNTCQWVYKGAECQYPGPGGGTIPGTTLSANANPIAANNQIAATTDGDICGKSILSCQLRNNQQHFGGFPGTGRTVPKS
jgi:phage-related protein